MTTKYHGKIKVRDQQHSREVQKALFTLGYCWYGHDQKTIRNEDKPYLYLLEQNGVLELNFGSYEHTFQDHEAPLVEIKIEAKVVPLKTVQYGGSTYREEDFVKALSTLEPI